MAVLLDKEFNSAIGDIYKSAVETAINCAEKFGFKIFLIGGVTRDLILGNPIKDIDIAVEGDAVDFANVLEQEYNCKILNIQEKLRTAKVQFSDGGIIDFASTREEKYTDSGVLPQAYNFGCLLENDVKRRDFTINTLALKLTGEEKYSLIDYCGGYQDILNKKIRILHDKSFIDDPSRIIRALKFKVRFNFELEENTQNLMNDYLNNINDKMPLERIKNEFHQYFNIKKDNLYDLIISTKAYKLISDNPILHLDNERFKSLKEFDLFNENEIWFIYIAALVVNSDYAIKRLNITSSERKVITEVRELLKKDAKVKDNFQIYKMFNKLNNLSIASYYIISGNPAVTKFLNALKDIQVLITGDDLKEIGFIPSPYFNKLFESILKEKLNGRLISKEEEINFVKKFLKKD